MKLWGRKETYVICAECRVLFDPEYATNPRFAHLCKTHRRPLEEREARKRAVMEWIERHWEEYEEAAKIEAVNRNASSMQSALQQQFAAHNLGWQGLSNFAGAGNPNYQPYKP